MTTTQNLLPTRPTRSRSPWTAGRIAGVMLGSAAVLAAGALATGAVLVDHVDHERRQGDYLVTDTVGLHGPGHAVTVEEIDLDGLSGDWLLGTARLRVTSDDRPVFIGVAPSDEVRHYLEGVDYSAVTDFDGDAEYDHRSGAAPTQRPTDLDIWETEAIGTGTQTVTWKPRSGDWTVMIMNQDGTSGVDVRADVGATAPILPRLVCWLFTASAVTGAAGVLVLLLVLLSLRRDRAVQS